MESPNHSCAYDVLIEELSSLFETEILVSFGRFAFKLYQLPADVSKYEQSNNSE